MAAFEAWTSSLPFLSSPQPQTRLAMQPTRALSANHKKNLLICLDAFGTLFTPKEPISVTYAHAATRHGLPIDGGKDADQVMQSFKRAFKGEAQRYPNYGRSCNMGPEKWWSNVSVYYAVDIHVFSTVAINHTTYNQPLHQYNLRSGCILVLTCPRSSTIHSNHFSNRKKESQEL